MNETISVEIPSEIENLQLPNPSLIEYYKDEKNRIFWLEGEIDASTLDLAKVIMRINIEDNEAEIPVEQRIPIKIFIDTIGGNAQVMWALMNTISISKTPVHTIAYCSAMSAGAYILAAGHKRFAFPGAVILVHSGGVGYQGTVEQVESAKRYYDSLDKRANDFFLQRTSIKAKDLKRKGAVDWYMFADEALANGIIDKVVEDFSEVL